MNVELTAIWRDQTTLIDTLPADTARSLEMARGEDATIIVALYDATEQPVDLDIAGSDKLTFSISSSIISDPIIVRQATKLSEVGHYLVLLVPGDTRDFSGTLVYDLWALKAGISRQVVRTSYLRLLP